MGDKEIVKEVHKIIESYFKGKKYIPKVGGKKGVFVTLKKQGNLRGCIGVLQQIDIKEGLVEATIGALNDPRFPPVRKEEIPELEMEVTLLGKMEEVKSPKEIQIGKHGVMLEYGHYRGLLLPQVATEYGWGVEEFLDHCCLKAGLPKECWTSGKVKIYKFEGVVIGENAEGEFSKRG